MPPGEVAEQRQERDASGAGMLVCGPREPCCGVTEVATWTNIAKLVGSLVSEHYSNNSNWL